MKKDNEKKIFIISIILIISITIFVISFNNQITFNNDLIGKAIQTDINIENSEENKVKERNIIFEDNLNKCEPVCPFGYNIINSTCGKSETCSGNVICGYYINDTIINMTNGRCATLNIVPDVSK